MTARRGLLAAMALLLLGTAVACSRGRNDAQIVGEVYSKINSDAQVTNKQVGVSSANGVVTLSGSAASEAERAAAANDAGQIEGVRTVVNNLLLPAAPAPAQPVAEAAPPAPEPPPAETHRAAAHKPSPYRERRHTASAPAPSSNGGLLISSASGNTSPMISSSPAPMPAPVMTPAVNITPSVPTPPPPPKPVTVEAGTNLSVRMIDAVDSGRNHPGDIFHATLDSPITVDDKVIIPEGADVQGRIVNLKSAGKFEGQPELALELTSLSMNGRKYSLVTNQYTQQGKSRGARTAKTVGSGAAIGAIIGAIAGGGKGAAIGAATGAGVGGGVEAAGHPEQVHIGTEALLSFRLQSPLTVTPVGSLERHRPENQWTAPDNSASSNPPPSAPPSQVYDDQNDNDSNRPVLKRRPPRNDIPPQ